MSAKQVYEMEVALRRIVNGNLDGSLDNEQARHVIAVAVRRAVSPQDIVAGFRRAVGGESIDGTPVKRMIDEALARKRHRRDN